MQNDAKPVQEVFAHQLGDMELRGRLEAGLGAHVLSPEIVQRRFIERAEIQALLAGLGPSEPVPPELRNATISKVTVEVVPVSQIVGGESMTDWTVSTSHNRGVPNIDRIANGLLETGVLQPGSAKLKVAKWKGKFYVQEGRHRVAAMKIIGVTEAPMLVMHFAEDQAA